MMTLGSLFDGSGGFPLAGIRCGLTPLWASEIKPYPIAVTRHHFAGMQHLGDITKVNGAEIPPVDVITFGSPCQDMSVAGTREGMKAEERGDDKTTRSGLFYQAIRIIREMREATHGKYPTFAIWENVPGAFSSGQNKGEDFRCVLEEFTRILRRGGVSIPLPKGNRWLPAGEIVGDGYSVAWRVLDAQYFPGTPQRRKRIYLVADFAGERAGKILFERDGMSRDPEPCEEAREGTADNAPGSTGGSSRTGLSASFMGGQGPKAGGLGYAEEVAPTLKSAPSGGNTVPDVVYALQGNGIDRALTAGCNGCGWREDVMYTLNTVDRPALCYPETARCLTARHDGSPCADRGPDVVCYAPVGNHCGAYEDSSVSATLQTKYHYGSGGDAAAVVYSSGAHGALSEGIGTIGTGTRAVHEMVAVYDARGNGDGNTVPTLTGDHQNRVTDYTSITVHPKITGSLCANSHPGGVTGQDAFNDMLPVISPGKPPRKYIVRRLTPLECCRLQGFPDGWGDIPPKESMSADEVVFWADVRRTFALAMGKAYKPFKNDASLLKWYNNKLHTDSAEYEMWGNGIALPCAVYVMEGVAAALRGELTA